MHNLFPPECNTNATTSLFNTYLDFSFKKLCRKEKRSCALRSCNTNAMLLFSKDPPCHKPYDRSGTYRLNTCFKCKK